MKRLMKFMLGIAAGVMLFGMTAFAAETVTPVDMIMYSNEYTVLYAEADLTSAVVVPNEGFPMDTPIHVTGVTESGFIQVDLNGTYYIAGNGLALEPSTGAAEVSSEETVEAAVVVEDYEVLGDYTYKTGWYSYRFLVIKNNTSETVDIYTSSIGYAADGTILSAADTVEYAVGPGCTTILKEYYDTSYDIAYYSTNMSTSRSNSESVLQDMYYVISPIEDGAVIQVTNLGTDVGDFVCGYALFFSNGVLVDYDSNYFTDSDFEIKAGATIAKQFTSYRDFDSMLFYMTGQRYRW